MPQGSGYSKRQVLSSKLSLSPYADLESIVPPAAMQAAPTHPLAAVHALALLTKQKRMAFDDGDEAMLTARGKQFQKNLPVMSNGVMTMPQQTVEQDQAMKELVQSHATPDILRHSLVQYNHLQSTNQSDLCLLERAHNTNLEVTENVTQLYNGIRGAYESQIYHLKKMIMMMGSEYVGLHGRCTTVAYQC